MEYDGVKQKTAEKIDPVLFAGVVSNAATRKPLS